MTVTLNDGASPYTRDAWKLSMVLTVKVQLILYSK